MESLETFDVQLAAYLAMRGHHYQIRAAPSGYNHAFFDGAGCEQDAETFSKGRSSVEPRAYACQMSKFFDLLGPRKHVEQFDPQL